MPRNIQIKPKVKSIKTEHLSKRVESKNSIWDILKFGESYTTLILGIVVVIISTIILITFVKGRENITRLTDEGQAAIKNTQETANKLSINTKQDLPKNEQISQITKSPTLSTDYTVVEGDTLWNIAERKYKSGYNWIDIRMANNLTSPDLLYVGQKLALPNVMAKAMTYIEQASAKQMTSNQVINSEVKTSKISEANYTVVKGDTLWDIAVRAYGDGYAWPKIANANKLINPSLIHSGNKLNIPRG